MRKYFENRLFQTVVILVLLSGAFILGTRKYWQSQTETATEKVYRETSPQDKLPAGETLPLQARKEGQPPVKKSFLVGAMPGIVSPDRLPKSFPPAATVTLPVIPEEARLENRIAEMDAFTAAKYLYNLQEAGTGVRMRALAAQAYAENPDDVEVVQFWAARNGSHPWRGSNPEGIAARRKLLEMRPNSPDVLIGLSRALWYTEPEEALMHLEKAEKLTSFTDSDIVKLKANAYQRMGDYETALDILKTHMDTEIIPFMSLFEEMIRDSPGLVLGSPRDYYDRQIQAMEEGKPLVEPHPRYLEAPRGNEGGEGVPTAPFEQQTAPTGGLPEDAPLAPPNGTLPPQTSPAETPQTPAGRTDAEWKHFLDNMTTEQASAFAQFLRAEFPELSKLLDEPADSTDMKSAMPSPSGIPPTPGISWWKLGNSPKGQMFSQSCTTPNITCIRNRSSRGRRGRDVQEKRILSCVNIFTIASFNAC